MGDAKHRFYRVAGLDTKFSAKDSLRKFERNVVRHLQDYGSDTISYVSDPVTKIPVCCVTDHPRFSIDSIK